MEFGSRGLPGANVTSPVKMVPGLERGGAPGLSTAALNAQERTPMLKIAFQECAQVCS